MAQQPLWRRLLRFDLSMLICFIVAVNLAVFANWQLRTGTRSVLRTTNENRVVLRPSYTIGWPEPFLRLNGIQSRLQTHTSADNDPYVEVLSWSAAVKTILVNLGLVCLTTLLLMKLKSALFAERTRTAPGHRASKKIPPELA